MSEVAPLDIDQRIVDLGIEKDYNDVLEQLNRGEEGVKSEWTKGLAMLYDTCKSAMVRAGYSIDEATKITNHMIVAFSFLAGGRGYYFPKGDTLKQALRNKQIYDDSFHHNAAELAEKYRLSEIMIYNIIKKQTDIERKRRRA